jgi:hypothetical protein
MSKFGRSQAQPGVKTIHVEMLNLGLREDIKLKFIHLQTTLKAR